MTFKQFVRKKRIAANLTLQQCADGLSLSNRSSFYNLENDDRHSSWSLEYLTLFAKILGVRVSELIAEWEREESATSKRLR